MLLPSPRHYSSFYILFHFLFLLLMKCVEQEETFGKHFLFHFTSPFFCRLSLLKTLLPGKTHSKLILNFESGKGCAGILELEIERERERRALDILDYKLDLLQQLCERSNKEQNFCDILNFCP